MGITQQQDPIVPRTRLGSGAMFDDIAHRYDALNRILSLGIDGRWRRATARSLMLPERARVLDIATGTGDLAIAIARMYPTAHVVGLDPSQNMLERAKSKVEKRALSARISFRIGEAENLPFSDGEFDAVTIAFGIRNVPERKRALREMARVTRAHGRIAVLELGQPSKGFLAPLARFHVHHVVPRLGALLSGSREYRYLTESVEAFPSPDVFGEWMNQSGLDVVDTKPLTFGACVLFVGTPHRRSGAPS